MTTTQPHSFYLRLSSENIPEKSTYVNTVADFENLLSQSIYLEDYKICVNDLHIVGELGHQGLKTDKEYSFSIYETLPSYLQLKQFYETKYHSQNKISATLQRYFDILSGWRHVIHDNYTTTIITPYTQLNTGVLARTNMTIRPELADTKFLDDVDKIWETKYKPLKTDTDITAHLLNELKDFEQNENYTTFTYEKKKRTMLNDEFHDLLKLRIEEYKEHDVMTTKLELVQLELAKYRKTDTDRIPKAISLATFLKYVRCALNMHPLYSFYTWSKEQIKPGKDRYNITLNSNRAYENFDYPFKMQMVFSEKAKKVMQRSSSVIDPLNSLQNISIEKIIGIDYDQHFVAFLELNKINFSNFGNTIRRVIKTIQITRNKNRRVDFSKHFAQNEFHSCDRLNYTTSIGVRLVDIDGIPIRFRNGILALTLYCERKSTWEI